MPSTYLTGGWRPVGHSPGFLPTCSGRRRPKLSTSGGAVNFLRVVDVSVMQFVTNGNICAPVMMGRGVKEFVRGEFPGGAASS